MAHQLHSQYLGNIQYWQVSKVIYESWAEAVEWAFTNDEYNRYGVTNYNHANGHQRWTRASSNWEYSPLFIDLTDDFNQRNGGTYYGSYYSPSSDYPNDLIGGYTLSYINYNILDEAYGLSSLNSSLKNHKINGTTNSQIDELLNLY